MKCTVCSTEYESNFCPNCGATASPQTVLEPPKKKKTKKPIYKRWWVWVIVVFVVLIVCNRIKNNRSKENYYNYTVPTLNNSAVFQSENELQTETKEETTAATEVQDDDMIDGMHRDFKEAMDSYEEFMTDYIDFMIKYKNSTDTLAMAADYLEYVKEYQEAAEKMDAWKNKDLNTKETAYYLDVTNRVAKKMLELQ